MGFSDRSAALSVSRSNEDRDECEEGVGVGPFLLTSKESQFKDE